MTDGTQVVREDFVPKPGLDLQQIVDWRPEMAAEPAEAIVIDVQLSVSGDETVVFDTKVCEGNPLAPEPFPMLDDLSSGDGQWDSRPIHATNTAAIRAANRVRLLLAEMCWMGEINGRRGESRQRIGGGGRIDGRHKESLSKNHRAKNLGRTAIDRPCGPEVFARSNWLEWVGYFSELEL
jgi:hypothetical protein